MHGYSDKMEYGSTGEALKHYKIGSGIEVNPERHKFDFTTKLILY